MGSGADFRMADESDFWYPVFCGVCKGRVGAEPHFSRMPTLQFSDADRSDAGSSE